MSIPGRPAIRVLVVDDHQMFADTIVQRLELEPDIEVVGVAADLDQAVRAARIAPPDVILFDLIVADIAAGAQVAQLLASLPRSRVLVLTGRVDPAALRGCVDAGCHGYLTKDRSSAELVDAVRRVAAGEIVIQASDHAVSAGLVSGPGLTSSTGHPPQAGTPAADAPVGLAIPGGLSRREFQVLRLLGEGLAAEGISQTLGISRNTARAHIQRVLDKLAVRSQLEAVAAARRQGWL